MNESNDAARPKNTLAPILTPRTAQNIVGALVIASVVGLVGIVRNAWISIDSLGDVQRQQADLITRMREDVDDLRKDYLAFKRKGDRYTHTDSNILKLELLRIMDARKIPPPEVRKQLDDHESRLIKVETELRPHQHKNYPWEINNGRKSPQSN